MAFDMGNISVVELGAGIGKGDDILLRSVPIDDDVAESLVEMMAKTHDGLNAEEGGPKVFNPSEKLAATEYLTLNTTEEACSLAHRVFQVGVLEQLENIRANLRLMRFYFARMEDAHGNKCIGIKGASVFKRVGSRNRVITLIDDSLKLYNDPIFQLDNDFDFLIEAELVKIWKPKQFVIICEMQEALRIAAPENIASISKSLGVFDLSSLEPLARSKSRVAALLASIRERQFMEHINIDRFSQRCLEYGVAFVEDDGKFIVEEEYAIRFLEVLDRRRYGTDFTDGEMEFWLASGREPATAQ